MLSTPPLCRQRLNSFICMMISEGKYNLAIVVKVFRQFSQWKAPREKDSYNKNMKTEGCESKPRLINWVFRQNSSSLAHGEHTRTVSFSASIEKDEGKHMI